MGLTSLAAACSGNKTIEKDGVINVATHMQHLNQLCLKFPTPSYQLFE